MNKKIICMIALSLLVLIAFTSCSDNNSTAGSTGTVVISLDSKGEQVNANNAIAVHLGSGNTLLFDTQSSVTMTLPAGSYSVLLVSGSDDYAAAADKDTVTITAGGTAILTVTAISNLSSDSTFKYRAIRDADNNITEYEIYGLADTSETEVEIPATYIDFNVTRIAKYTFRNSSVTSVDFGTESNISAIDSFAFYQASALKEIILPSSVTSFGDGVFASCTSLEKADLSNARIISITGTFGDCSSLKSVSLPSSATSISSNAFRRCSALTTISIPASVTTISSNAFNECEVLSQITYGGTMAAWKSAKFSYENMKSTVETVTVTCSDGSIAYSASNTGGAENSSPYAAI